MVCIAFPNIRREDKSIMIKLYMSLHRYLPTYRIAPMMLCHIKTNYVFIRYTFKILFKVSKLSLRMCVWIWHNTRDSWFFLQVAALNSVRLIVVLAQLNSGLLNIVVSFDLLICLSPFADARSQTRAYRCILFARCYINLKPIIYQHFFKGFIVLVHAITFDKRYSQEGLSLIIASAATSQPSAPTLIT